MSSVIDLRAYVNPSVVQSPRSTSPLRYTWAVTRAIVAGLACPFTILFVMKIQYVSRAVIAIFAALSFLSLAGMRLGREAHFEARQQAKLHGLTNQREGTGYHGLTRDHGGGGCQHHHRIKK